jgi:hypothetical protein
MMGRSPGPPPSAMDRSSAMVRCADLRPSRPWGLAVGLAIGLLPAAAGLQTSPASAAPAAPAFPSAETFKQIRLAALACGRENTAESCDKARKLADPLIDHPRLPASCIDALWAITQRAKVATSNSLARRDAIDAPAQDVRFFCKQQPVRTKEKEKAPASPFGSGASGGGSGFGFGSPAP